jgi:hypothetical protein
MSILGEVTLIHKDFAKSKGWQIIAFDFAVCLVLAVALICLKETAWDFVQYSVTGLAVMTGTILGLDMKKMRGYLKTFKEEEGK